MGELAALARQPMFTEDGAGAARGRCFPFEPFRCCPSPVKMLLPGTWQRIQDWTHLILVIGVLACIALVVQTFMHLYYGPWEMFCAKEILTLVFILPCTMYCIRIIGQYDDRLQAKQLAAKQQKENLTKAYNDLLADMDGLLSKSTESSAGLAEKSFESKRRDFARFLERAKVRYATFYKGTKADSEQLLKEFKRFCANWLNVFAECSIDPVNRPKHVVTKEELNRCTNLAEVADLCLERLKVTEVRFISQQRDQDAQFLRRNRNEIRRYSNEDARLALPAPATAPAAARSANRKRGVSWFSLGCGHGCRFNRSPHPDGFPREMRCGCCRLVVLSKEHWMLMTGIFVGWAIIALVIAQLAVSGKIKEISQDTSGLFEIFEVLLAQTCLIVMLIRFEELDTIQQLEREVRELEHQNVQVQQQREKMGEFWNNVQQLTELWLYRTVPRLDLYKEVHSQLEDAPSEDLLVSISGANQQLEDLDRSIGALDVWRGDGSIGADDKKRFAKAINQICQEQDFDDLLVKLEDVISKHPRCCAGLLLPSLLPVAAPQGFASTSAPNFTGNVASSPKGALSFMSSR